MSGETVTTTVQVRQRSFWFTSGSAGAEVECRNCGWKRRPNWRDHQKVYDLSNDHECIGVELYGQMLERHEREAAAERAVGAVAPLLPHLRGGEVRGEVDSAAEPCECCGTLFVNDDGTCEDCGHPAGIDGGTECPQSNRYIAEPDPERHRIAGRTLSQLDVQTERHYFDNPGEGK